MPPRPLKPPRRTAVRMVEKTDVAAARRERNGGRSRVTDAFVRPGQSGLIGTRTLTGSLPLDLTVVDGEAKVRPSIVFAPPHLHAPGPSLISQTTSQQTASTSSASTVKSGGGHGGRLGGDSDAGVTTGTGSRSSTAHGNGADEHESDNGATSSIEIDGASTVLDAKFADAVADLLNDPGAGTAATRMARAADASYDFIEYILLREPDDPITRSAGYPPQPIPKDPRYTKFVAAARVGITDFVDYGRLPLTLQGQQASTGEAIVVRDNLLAWWVGVAALRAFNRLQRYDRTAIIAAIPAGMLDPTPDGYYGYCLGHWLMTKDGQAIRDFFVNGQGNATDHMYTLPYWEAVLSEVFTNYFDVNGIKLVDPSAPTKTYPFEPFPIDEALFGLRIVHRQSWHQLMFARGDLVGTVPLGPRETKKVTVKTTRRMKTARTSEESLAFETSAETTSTSRDVNEVVDEATSKLNRHVDAEVGGGYPPFFSAKVSGGASDEAANTSKQTKTNLNELMQKTASRMKRDTKVTIATEGETTFEQVGSAELTNPNDEVAVTYLYRRLQQRYWVSTQIDEVNSVVFVPEPIPDWSDINENEDWIREHGEIIQRVLLDKSFASTVASIRAEPGNLAYLATTVFSQSANAAISSVRDPRTFAGAGDVPDMLGPGQQFYERDFERRSTLAMSQARRSHQTRDLIEHIRRNILYYMRAIWASEDPDQRMQRYSRLRVPVSWTFVPLNPLPSNANAGDMLDIDGVFMPDMASAMPLDRVIDPVGPIGYLFNCVIWRVRDDPKLINLHQALAHLRAAYTRFAVTVAFGANSTMNLVQAVAFAPRSFSADYTITYRSNQQRWYIQIPNQPQSNWIQLNQLKDGSINVFGIRLWLEGAPTNNETATVSVRVTGDLEDPHLRLIAVQNPLPPAAQEDAFFTDVLLEEMANLFEWPFSVGNKPTWSNLTPEQKAEARRSYHRYLMLRESGRLVTLDTANLMLDIEVGRSAALEPFKRLHRYIDVMKEREEMLRRQLDNTRRHSLLEKGRLADPDIERVGVIAGPPGHVKDLVVLDDPED